MFRPLTTLIKSQPTLKEPPMRCPKCEQKSFIGPRYIKYKKVEGQLVFYECLEYKCTKCGYTIDVQTKDTKEKHETE